MPIVSHVQLIVERPTEAPGRIPEKWAENLKNEAEWLSEKRDLVIPDETAFQNRIAETSQAGYQTVLNPAFWSRSGLPTTEIKGNRLAKIKEAFKKWQRGLSHAFQTVEGVFAKRFKEAVDLRRDLYSEGAAQRTLAYTGTKFQFRGPAALSGYWLTAVPGIEGLLRSGDKILAGTPLRICVPAKAFTLRSALLARLVQAGVVITNNGYDPAIIARINQVNNEVIQGFVDPALDLIPFVAGGDSHVDFVVIEGQLYLDIKISKM